ncbi:class I SAM-dependent DNA methyltransferase [Oceanicola sp. S124]|uniref:class I SAM-dependent DNA methyltransferase n=1 Tax=Oceanicola sp. S124 TaxID=1042378 RepID=UPI0002557D1F|nr:methyltransferase [Oceanicola sp. S124]
MVAKPFTSGNPLADRRACYAATMADTGDIAAAIEVLASALEITPDWAAGWFRLGEYHDQAGAPDLAGDAWRRAVALDPGDPFGAGLKLDLQLQVPVAEMMPAAFVELLFDQYAPRFETSLVDQLSYRGPQLLASALRGAGFVRAERALDMGCGTGLMGQEMRSACDWLGGCDISAGMLAEARAKGIYDQLRKEDLGQLAPVGPTYDLICAADVFNYLGALEQIVGWCAGALLPRGRIAFTMEEGSRPVELRSSRRFAHAPDYVREVLDQAGFQGITMQGCVLRRDRGQDVPAFCVVATLERSPWARDQSDEAQMVPA